MCYNRFGPIPVPKMIMMKRLVLPLVGCLAAGILLLPWFPGQAQQVSATYFPQTGHYLDEPFLSTFEATGGLQTWGPPITEAFAESDLLVQYFQRARMECPLGNQDASQVELSPLGELLGQGRPRTSPVSNSMIEGELCRYFPETGHNVCFSFLAFYTEHGGPDILGLPISELTLEPAMITQYFQRSRIEWHTDAPPDAAMRLGALGQEYFAAKGLDPSLLFPVESRPSSPASAGQIKLGDQVRVGDTGGAGLRLRSAPGTGHETIEMLDEGTVLRVVGGPQVADGFTWWYLEYGGALGWCASDWLELVQPVGTP